MEGPTPSSAIFYGAISIHAGAYLLLRVQPHARAIRAGLRPGDCYRRGHSHSRHHRRPRQRRRQNFAGLRSLTQVGVVFVEIGLGWKWIAVAHILGHATVRTLQFLRAPSMLHDYHQMHSAIGGEIAPTGKASGGSVSGTRSVVALPLGARPRPSRHDPRSLGDSSSDAALQAFCQAGSTSDWISREPA